MPKNKVVTEGQYVKHFKEAFHIDPNNVDIVLDNLIAFHHCSAYGKDLKKVSDVTQWDEVLIENTQYDGYDDEVADKDKIFYVYRPDKKEPTLEQKSLNDLLDEQEEPGGVFAKPTYPKLSFFGKLRHRLSFIFGEPDAIKEYNRGMEVYQAKKLRAIEGKYNYNKLHYNRELLDPQKAYQYKTEGIVPSEEHIDMHVADNEQIKEDTLEKAKENRNEMIELYKKDRVNEALDYIQEQYTEGPKKVNEITMKIIEDAFLHENNKLGRDLMTNYILSLKKDGNVEALDKIMLNLERKGVSINSANLLEIAECADQKENLFHTGFKSYLNHLGIGQKGPQQGPGKQKDLSESKDLNTGSKDHIKI